MREFTFWIPLQATGENADDAWENGLDGWLEQMPEKPPEPIFGKDDPIPSAEILGGTLSEGFTIDHGDDEETQKDNAEIAARDTAILEREETKEAKPTRNRVKCKKCGDIIESTYGHDFKYCKCGAVAVDGGNDYHRRLGNREDWEEMP